jgi:putative ABC transport system ATP-binding protein
MTVGTSRVAGVAARPSADAPAGTRRAVVEGAAFRYDAETVLRFPDIEVRHGDELVLLGPSGSGKSTLLHLLAGLLRPQEGTVAVSGQDLARLSTSRLEGFRARHVGLVFQDFHLVDGYTALDNVALSLLAAGASPGDALTRAEELLRQLGLGHRLDHTPGALSTGERQRVAVARATAPRPSLLLADEPTAHLDRGRAQEALTLLREAAAQADAALVVATHDPLVTDAFETHVQLA